MENQFFVDSKHLSKAALEKKHRLENDPTTRKNHMEYLPGMEQIESDVRENVMSHMNSYDASIYTAKDVRAALEHETCSIDDFKALLSPAAEPFLEQMAQRARLETSKHFGNTVHLFTPLYIANYCENYCVYCGFNCYNHIKRMKLTREQIENILTALDSGDYGMILRAKGMVPAEDGTWIYFDYVPEEKNVRAGKADVTGKLCVIGANIKEDKLEELFGA